MESIYIKNLNTNKDFEDGMELDVSKNNISDLKFLADIITKFSGIKVLNLSGLSRIRDSALDFVKALRYSYSLVKVDLS